MRAILRQIKLLVENVYYRLTLPKFYHLKMQTDGMLSPRVYERLYRAVCDLPDLDIVEVGGAAGAASIAIAWAMQDTGKRSKLIVVEKLEGGTRSDYGSYEENLMRIKRHFEEFRVHDHIVLYPHELTLEDGHEALDLISTNHIAAFIHDADGRLDRDFQLFWPRLVPGGLIVVDDYREFKRFKPISERHPQGGIKRLLTYRLLNQFIEWGLFDLSEVYDGITAFGTKPHDADLSRLDTETCDAIRQEVWQERAEHFEPIEQHDQVLG